jgi:hypothetical protein
LQAITYTLPRDFLFRQISPNSLPTLGISGPEPFDFVPVDFYNAAARRG